MTQAITGRLMSVVEKKLIACVTSVVKIGRSLMGIMAGARLNKDEVNYRQHEKCASCTHYYYPNSCDIVDGNISPDNVCNKWELKPRSNEGKDGEFYMEEYTKSKAE